jgi:pilus assembly protein CpaB
MTRRVFAVLIAVVFAAIGTGAVLLYVRSADARALEGKEVRTVLVADRTIPAGTTAHSLRDGKYLREEPMPVDTVPEDAMSAIAAADDALVMTAALQPGHMLLRAMLGAAVSDGTGLAIPKGMLAVDARIQANAFSPRSLTPGARVAVFYTFSPITAQNRDAVSGAGVDRARDAIIITQPLLSDVEVLAVVGGEPADGDGPALQPPTESNAFTVTLALNQEDAQKLANAVAIGGLLNVALRNDSSIVRDDGGVDNRTLFD